MLPKFSAATQLKFSDFNVCASPYVHGCGTRRKTVANDGLKGWVLKVVAWHQISLNEPLGGYRKCSNIYIYYINQPPQHTLYKYFLIVSRYTACIIYMCRISNCMYYTCSFLQFQWHLHPQLACDTSLWSASEHRMWGKVMSMEMGNFRSMLVSTSRGLSSRTYHRIMDMWTLPICTS